MHLICGNILQFCYFDAKTKQSSKNYVIQTVSNPIELPNNTNEELLTNALKEVHHETGRKVQLTLTTPMIFLRNLNC